MHILQKTPLTYALKHRLRISRRSHGHYYLHGVDGERIRVSNEPTAKSALIMMRAFVRRQRTS